MAISTTENTVPTRYILYFLMFDIKMYLQKSVKLKFSFFANNFIPSPFPLSVISLIPMCKSQNVIATKKKQKKTDI